MSTVDDLLAELRAAADPHAWAKERVAAIAKLNGDASTIWAELVRAGVDAGDVVRLQGQAAMGENAGDGGERLPLIQVNNRQLRDIRQEALDALRRANEVTPAEPVIYVRGGALARVACDEQGGYSIQPLDVAGLTGILSDVADWLRVGKDTRTHVSPPAEVARDILGQAKWENLPALEGVVASPTFGAGGVLHDQPGYNPQTRLYYAGHFKYPQMTAAEGKALIGEMLQDFPFLDDASRAHAREMILLPFMRPMIRGATPLHLVDAPMPGTGKGLLIDVCAYPATGRWLPSMSEGKDDDEWRKRITAALLRGETHIHIDNISRELDSSSLASAVTQSVFADRLLGQTRTVSLQVRQIWCANGNNVVLSDELARRVVWIRLDANEEKPWNRSDFHHKDLRGWVAANRPRLVGACLAMIQKWKDEGMPRSAKRKGSFDEWAAIMGGILEANDIDGFLENESQLFEGKTDAATALTEFVDAWRRRYGEGLVTSDELFKLASEPDERDALAGSEWLGLLGDQLPQRSERGRRSAMGQLLKRHEDKVISGCKICYEGRSHGKTQWRLAILNNAAQVVAEYGL